MNRLICYLILILLPFNAQATAIVGYGATDSALSAGIQELFYMGFEVGIESSFSKRPISDYLIVDQEFDGSPLAAQNSVDRLLKKNVKLIVGYSSSHEALLASKLTIPNGVLSIFTGASHSTLDHLGPTVLATGESMDRSAESVLEFIERHFPGSKGVLITNPYAVFSKNGEDQFNLYLGSDRFKSLKIKALHLSRDLTLDDSTLDYIQNNHIGFLCLTSYPSDAARFFEQLQIRHMRIPIIVTPSWSSGDIEFIRRLLAKTKAPIHAQTIWLKGSTDSLPFEKKIKDKYGREPTTEMAYGYDAGIITGKLLGRLGPHATREDVVKAFYSNPCFQGTATGDICFKQSGGHPKRTPKFLRFSKSGFVPFIEGNR